MRIILARHGDAIGTKGKFHGLKDDPMTSAGRSEIYQLVKELAHYQPNAVLFSPLKRTRDSAHIISNELNIPAQPAKALLPLDLGDFVGKPIDDFKEQVRYYLAHPNETIPGGSTVNQWARKYLPTFEKYLTAPNSKTLIFMTHGRNIVLSKAYMDQDQAAPNYDKDTLVDNKVSTEHGGYAIAEQKDGKSHFHIVTPKSVPRGTS